MESGIETINFKERAVKERLISRYAQSINLISYVEACLTQLQELENVFQDILCKRSIENGEDYTLDVIGRLVGQPREIVDAPQFKWFGFQGNPVSGSFGDRDDPSVGARFRSTDEVTSAVRQLTNEEYRTFILARTFRNITDCTIEEIIRHLSVIFNAPYIKYENTPGILGYSIEIGRVLTTAEKLIITNTNILPEPSGTVVIYSDLNGQIN